MDSNARISKSFTEEDELERDDLVRAIILNHLDDEYHKEVMDMLDPRKIMYNLENQRLIEASLNKTIIRKKLERAKMGKIESAAI